MRAILRALAERTKGFLGLQCVPLASLVSFCGSTFSDNAMDKVRCFVNSKPPSVMPCRALSDFSFLKMRPVVKSMVKGYFIFGYEVMRKYYRGAAVLTPTEPSSHTHSDAPQWYIASPTSSKQVRGAPWRTRPAPRACVRTSGEEIPNTSGAFATVLSLETFERFPLRPFSSPSIPLPASFFSIYN